MPYEPIIPEGHHLGTSHNVDGASTGHLFEDGTNKLKGHAAWEWVNEPESGHQSSFHPDPPRQLTPEEMELAAELAGIIVAGIIRAVVVATPQVKRWWSRRVVPAGRTAWRRVTSIGRRTPSMFKSSSSFVEEAMFVASTTGVELVQPGQEVRLSSAEWEYGFRSMLVEGEFAREQMRVLSIARVDEQETILREPNDEEQLTAQEFVDRVRLMLEANPALLNKETSTKLLKAFKLKAHPLSPH